jgi:transcriptional regulator with XRE-family HTH domain
MSTIIFDNLSSRIKKIRDNVGLSKKEFALRLGISAPYATELESGKAKTVSKTLAKLIEYEFRFNMHWVLTGEGPMRKEATPVPAGTLLDDSFESEVLAGVWRAMSTDERRELIKNLLSRREPA